MSVDREVIELARKALLRSLAEPDASKCCRRPLSRRVVEASSLAELLQAVDNCRAAVVFFDSPTCPYCRIFRPIFYEAAEEVGDRIAFVRILVTDVPEAAAAFHVMGVPTVIAFRRGRQYRRITGLPAPGVFEALLEELLSAEGCPLPAPAGE